MCSVELSRGVRVIFFVAACLSANHAAAAFLLQGTAVFGEQAQEQFEPDLFTLSNLSDPGYQITRIVIDTAASLGVVIFDTAIGGAGETSPGPNQGAWAPTVDTEGGTGFSTFTEGADGGTVLGANFSDFDPGEIFVFTVDVDNTTGTNTYDRRYVRGDEFAGSTLTVFFTGPDVVGTAEYTADFLPVGDGHNSANAVAGAFVPIPATAWLMGSGLTGLFGVAWRRKLGA